MFNVADSNNWMRWNIGGWDNTKHAVQSCVNGVQSTGPQVNGSITTGQWYDVRIAIQGTAVSCYLNNTLAQTFTAGSASGGGIGLATWNTQAEFRNIVVTGADTQVLYQSDFSPPGGATGEISVDTSKPLNPENMDSLKLTMISGSGSVGVANSGFWGIPVGSGSTCKLRLHAAASAGFTGPLTVRLESADGGTVYAQTSFSGLSTGWAQFTADLVPTGTDTNARLVVGIDQPGTVWLDVVSLFPQATFKNRDRGMRADLANAVADMKPAFLRFPGGCYVEGRSLATAFRWKKTIGDISARPGHQAYWGYISTDGLGYHEYLQYSEDIGAEPLFCINAGISHSDVVPLALMGEYVQDALDAIEYANGPVTTTWGAKRAANGHPEPFNLKYIEIGNENGGADYNSRYALFYDAIKAAYPEMKLIACVWGGTPTSRPFDLMDEHYYTNPATMASYATKYDNYNRSGPKVFVGEYAVTTGYGTYGNLSAALGEAAFMTGIERNCDIVSMASYAPLFAQVNMMTWKPDAIYYDNWRWFGTPAYHVQKMFANHMGSVLLPMSQDFSPGHAGGIGVSTWNTQAEFRNIVVTGADSQVLYESDFAAAGTSGWTPKSGTWAVDSTVTPNAYKQSANGNDYRSTYTGAGSTAWNNYTLTLQARKTGGSEGFLILFNVADANNFFWWNLGGWNNTQHAVEYSINGTKTSGPKVSGSINTNQWYDIRISIQGGKIHCYLDNVLTQTFSFPAPVQSVASMNEATREIILKSVNTTGGAVTANIVLNGTPVIAPTAARTLLTSASPSDENSMDSPNQIVPVTSAINTGSPSFPLGLPAYSATILRIQALAEVPQGLSVTAGNQQAVIVWNPTPGAATYSLKRATSLNGPFVQVADSLTGTSLTDTGLSNGTPYYYTITAVNPAGESEPATAVSATPELPPITFQELSGPAIRIDGETVHLTVSSSVQGRIYTLQRSGSLLDSSWETLGVSQVGTGHDLTFTDTRDRSLPRRFYRVRLSAQ
jgi:alpha-L-arabinofuranosidase